MKSKTFYEKFAPELSKTIKARCAFCGKQHEVERPSGNWKWIHIYCSCGKHLALKRENVDSPRCPYCGVRRKRSLIKCEFCGWEANEV